MVTSSHLNRLWFSSILTITLAYSAAYASPEKLILICEYSALTDTAGPHMTVVPREIEVNFPDSRVRWNGSNLTVPAEIDESAISFKHGGFIYSISRLTGQIRFSNPAKIALWQEYKKKVVVARMKQGKSASESVAEVDQRLESEFTAREHVGECSPSSAPKF